jgi:phospholipase/carboxylesterase
VPGHMAFRALDVEAVRSMRVSLRDYGPTEVHDRKYFLSLYVRDPAGILMEYATDGPGMTVDEAPDALGQTLFMPPHEADRADDLKAMLPQFALPGEERFPVRNLPFLHRFHRPQDPDGTVLVLLHGTGGNEADLMPVARRMAPRATLLGVRGRANEDGSNRWYRRSNAMTFDEADLRSEAEAFAAFVDGAVKGYGLDADRLVFIGYSNGASFLAGVIQLHPGAVRRAILLRAADATVISSASDITKSQILMLNARDDILINATPRLAAHLTARGAVVEVRTLPVGHALSPADAKEAAQWLGPNVPAP